MSVPIVSLEHTVNRRRTPRPLAALVVGAAGALALGACGGAAADEPAADAPTAAGEAGTMTVEHAQGETEVELDPETVVVFDYASLDTLDTLGVDVAGVPQENLPDFLSDYAGADHENVGTLFEPDLEAINAIDPDLVIVAGRSAAAYPQLSEHWPTIDLSVDYATFMDDVHAHTELLGEIFGEQDLAADALADLDETVEQVRAATEGAGPGLILSTSGGEVTVYGEDSRFGLIHSVLGVPAAVNEVEALPHGEAISFEMIRDTNPDWLFVNDRDAAIGQSGESAEAILDNELVHATTAWEKEQVVYLDAQRWYIVMAGVDNTREMFAQIGDAFA
nr:siderophore ABC transporter substrate-binding protein [Pseudactinotalea sp. HY160]